MIWTLLIALCLVLVGTENAYAYLDPGTGSMLLQGLLAAIAGSVVAVKLYWGKIKSFFSSKSSAASDRPSAGTSSQYFLIKIAQPCRELVTAM